MPTQLRIYTINRGKLDHFVDAWRKGVVPLRAKFGFRVDAAWVIRERSEFVWIVSRDGPDWAAQEKAYYASAERAALDPDPAQYIARAEQWLITPVL
ncbi:MAG: NIPSNAP family protein [Armatimonadetes bacterium]|nr:NIPSNAP family protein [Armatimonadota bacterium]